MSIEKHSVVKHSVVMCSSQLEAIQFEPMSPENLSLVLDNEHCSYTHPWREDIFIDCMKTGHECWIVTGVSEVIGHSVLSVAGKESHLQNVCIRSDIQRRGCGRALVEFMLGRARSHQVSRVFLEIRTSNLPACKLYETLGFNEIGTRPGYYPTARGREDAIVFAMELFYDA